MNGCEFPWKNRQSRGVASSVKTYAGLELPHSRHCVNDGMCTAIREASFNHSFVLAALLLQMTSLRGSKSESVVFHEAIVW